MSPTASRFASSAALALALFGPGAAIAAPTLTVEARVDEDLRGVSGTVVSDQEIETWVDLLASLPEPEGDRDWMRTFPGRRDVGAIDHDPSTGAFETRLPRRFGALGSPRRGLFANGGWLPQPEGLPSVEWRVRITFPEGVTGVVGDVVGTGTLEWTGVAERVGIAAIRGATVTEIEAGRSRLVVVSKGRLARRLESELGDQLVLLEPEVEQGAAAVVIAPMRTRLARPGPGVLYLSDRSWRLTPGLRHFHDAPIRRGLAAALIDAPDDFTRQLQAAAVSDERVGPGMQDTLKWVSWVPLIDQTLNDRSMPFATETLDDAVPDHPVRDDLAEVMAPTWPGTAVVLQLDAAYGEGTADAVGRALRDGTSLEPDVETWLATFDAPMPEQDYRLDVDADTVIVTRHAPGDANAQAVVVDIGGERQIWLAPEGPGEQSWPRSPEGPVVLDPDGALPQTSRIGERAPARFKATVAGSAGNISLSPLALDGFVVANLRRADDSRTVFAPGVYFGDQALVDARFSLIRMAGEPLNALVRTHQLAIGPSVMVLDPRYNPIDESATGAAMGASWTWDTKGEALSPLKGHTIRVGAEAGSLLGSPQGWQLARARAAGVAALHPRAVLAAQVTGAVSSSDFAHKELDLGALEGMLSVPIGTVRGSARSIVRTEIRLSPIRYASVPLLLLWGSELQVTGGVEAGLLQTRTGPVTAVGATAGLGLVFDWIGAKPSMTGLTAGWPVSTQGLDLQATPWPQVVVRAKQWF